MPDTAVERLEAMNNPFAPPPMSRLEQLLFDPNGGGPPWFVGAPRDDGLVPVEDGRRSELVPFYCEPHTAELIVTAINTLPTLLSQLRQRGSVGREEQINAVFSRLCDFPVLGGRVTRFQAEAVVDALAALVTTPAGDPGWTERQFTKYDLPNAMAVSFDREDEGINVTLWNEAGDPIVCHTLGGVTTPAGGAGEPSDPSERELAFMRSLGGYQAIFNAIADAVNAEPSGIGISVTKFVRSLAAPAPPLGEGPWLPITDAPRNGEKVDLRCENLVALNCYWGDYDRPDMVMPARGWINAPTDFKPTHFRLRRSPAPLGEGVVEALRWIASHDNTGLTDGSGATRACIDAIVDKARTILARVEGDLGKEGNGSAGASGSGEEVSPPEAQHSAGDCPHADPFRYCAYRPDGVSACPIQLPGCRSYDEGKADRRASVVAALGAAHSGSEGEAEAPGETKNPTPESKG